MRAFTEPSQTVPLLGVWLIGVCTSAAAPVVTVTLPDGSTATPLVISMSGGYVAEYVVATVGRYVARAVSAAGAVDFTAWVAGPTAAADMPDLAAVDAYLGEHSFTDDELLSALDTELQAQRDVCRVPAVYVSTLREAVLRRVARNLAMRQLPLAMVQGDAEAGGATLLPGRDPEVRRLEAPYRRVRTG